ncbi:MAG: RagB/SusD family nutrient uptake outer membrane protein, partial [Prevotella sp.]|nr:RagB/SusD family nutrient uptake outer membrane protein [Prevotella sp.]
MKKIAIIISVISILFGSYSCSDMLETDSTRQVFNPQLNEKTDSVYYALGVLQAMQQLADQYAFQGEMRGDLVQTTEYTDNNLRQLANFTATTANKYDSAYVYYRVINNCNYYIAHRDTSLRTGD